MSTTRLLGELPSGAITTGSHVTGEAKADDSGIEFKTKGRKKPEVVKEEKVKK